MHSPRPYRHHLHPLSAITNSTNAPDEKKYEAGKTISSFSHPNSFCSRNCSGPAQDPLQTPPSEAVLGQTFRISIWAPPSLSVHHTVVPGNPDLRRHPSLFHVCRLESCKQNFPLSPRVAPFCYQATDVPTSLMWRWNCGIAGGVWWSDWITTAGWTDRSGGTACCGLPLTPNEPPPPPPTHTHSTSSRPHFSQVSVIPSLKDKTRRKNLL